MNASLTATQSTLPAEDFRAPAIAESRRLLTRAGMTDPLEAAVSLCVESGPDGPAVLKHISTKTTALLIVGAVLVLGGILLALAVGDSKSPLRGIAIPAGIGAGIVGAIVFVYGVVAARMTAKRHLADRYEQLKQVFGDRTPIFVTLEDVASYNKLKMIGDDVGYVVFEPPLGLILIEGVCCRYFLYAEDITDVSEVEASGHWAVRLDAAIGEASLSMTLSGQVVRHEWKRQTRIGARKAPLSPLVDSVMAARSASQGAETDDDLQAS